MVRTIYKVTLYHGGERPTQTKYAYSQDDADYLATTAEHAIIEEINYEKWWLRLLYGNTLSTCIDYMHGLPNV